MGAVLLWWYKIRPYEYRDETSSTISQDNLQQPVVADSTPIMKHSHIDSVFLGHGAVPQDSNDFEDRGKLSRNLSNILMEPSLGISRTGGGDNIAEAISPSRNFEQPRKQQNVTFNELVERIEIETEPTRDSNDK